ncbi:hypothetical protein AIOL_001397 [Candidatus Rhodobacter oscarellae]|uniref:Uncharacterized protein n=1 Tax=Candidatus Rhodobacter oscarellae TaxID=1675527 RepID=A0A0J9GSG7_9RHOB|nr:hypothetical protein [Candidatus Rhodobacter lobularis]KMW56443.1 hypothetical protein AIOL_001397 [Candidatus Rhodobacter lobularis]
MYRKTLATLVTAAALIAGASAASAQNLIPLSKLNGVNLGDSLINQGRPLPALTGRIGVNCPAPGVQSITARRMGGNRVRIEAVIKNVGGINWVSNRNQQTAMIGDDFGRANARRDFTRLDAGSHFVLRHDVNWNLANEFPSGFRASINYDPDIYIDGNPANDDCRRNDNSRSISAAEINALFR